MALTVTSNAALKDLAAKYRGNKSAPATLVSGIRHQLHINDWSWFKLYEPIGRLVLAGALTYAELGALFFIQWMGLAAWMVPLTLVLNAHHLRGLQPFAFATTAAAMVACVESALLRTQGAGLAGRRANRQGIISRREYSVQSRNCQGAWAILFRPAGSTATFSLRVGEAAPLASIGKIASASLLTKSMGRGAISAAMRVQGHR